MIVFNDILKDYLALKNMPTSNQYYKKEAELKIALTEFIKTDFSTLKSVDLLKLCYLVYKYTPIAPYRFLMECGELSGMYKD